LPSIPGPEAGARDNKLVILISYKPGLQNQNFIIVYLIIVKTALYRINKINKIASLLNNNTSINKYNTTK